MKVKGESEAAQLCRLLATPWTAAYQAPPSMGFSRQEYWSGLPLPSLEEISSLSNSIVFLYFFALIAEEGFLISPCYSLELCTEMGITFLFSFAFASLLFSAICKVSSDNNFAFLHFFFLEMVLITACKIGRLWKAPLCIAVKLTNSGHSKDKKSG